MNIIGVNKVGNDLQVTVKGETIPVSYINTGGNYYRLVRYAHVEGRTEALYEAINVFKVDGYEYAINTTAPLYTFNKTY